MKTALLTLLLTGLAAPSAAGASINVSSLFDRLGVANPVAPVSTLLPQRRITAALQIASASPSDAIFIAAPAPTTSPASPPLQEDPIAAGAVTFITAAPATVQIAKLQTQTKAEPVRADKANMMSKAPQSAWAQTLSTYGRKDGDLNRFDYAGLSANGADMKALDGYIQKLAAMTPSAMGRNEALAYWSNLYNALTVQVVAKNWPVKSIKEIKSGVFKPGPWDLKLVTVEGRAMSLNDIEHGTMRANYKEPRIHYMVNCASIGCPNLMLRPWKADTLDADADAAAKAFINSPRGANVSGGKLTVSSIFKWYKVDFGGNDAGVIAHLRDYASGDLKTALSGVSKISKDQYNWDANAK